MSEVENLCFLSLKIVGFSSACIKSPLKHLLRPVMDFENVGGFLCALIRRFHQGGKSGSSVQCLLRFLA